MELEEVLELDIADIEAELCRQDFFYFVQEFWEVIIAEDPVWNWHIPYLCYELQEYGYRLKNRIDSVGDVCINIPPGTSKSTIVTIMFPAWLWTIDQTLRIISGSYSASLSTDHAVKSRDIIQHEKYKKYFPEVVIRKDFSNKTHYKNTKGGERYVTSVGGTITGIHAHAIIIDDPLNPKQAASASERETANTWMTETLSTRKVHKSQTITFLVMQRLHELDCTGDWLEKQKKGKLLNHICLPGEIADNVFPPELKDRYIGGKLDPLRLGDKALKQLSIDLGSYGYAGQIMQTPVPSGGGIWKEWFAPIPDHLFPKPEELQQYGTDWDLAYTDDENNSACARVTAGKKDNKMYIDTVDWKWVEFPKLVAWMQTQAAPHHIEAKASGKSARQTLVNMGIPAIEVKVIGGDKEARANIVTPYAEAGMICVRESQLDKIYNDTKQGILRFPKGENDDLQDAIVQAITRLLAVKKFKYS